MRFLWNVCQLRRGWSVFIMNCIWEDIPNTEDERGWRRTTCPRCNKETAPWPKDGLHHRECTGLPFAHEWREWLAIFSAAAGVTRAMAICQYIRWRANGSPLDKLPPGIPPPPVVPKNAGLSDAEVQELLPGEDDPTLIGNRIAALTAAIGIPHCGGCEARRQWLNKAHEWLKFQLDVSRPRQDN